LASRRPLPKRVVPQPVGDKHDPAFLTRCESAADLAEIRVDEGACPDCGYHVCSCVSSFDEEHQALEAPTPIELSRIAVDEIRKQIEKAMSDFRWLCP
jgi:hypothetical protein